MVIICTYVFTDVNDTTVMLLEEVTDNYKTSIFPHFHVIVY